MNETASSLPSPKPTPTVPTCTPTTPSKSDASPQAVSNCSSSATVPTDRTPKQISLSLIDPGPADSRRVLVATEELSALANSIARDGLLQPIIVRSVGDRYTTIAGRRRRDAARLAGLSHISAYVMDTDDATAWRLSVSENHFRTQLSPFEEAAACADAIETAGLTLEQVATTFGRSTRWVQDRLDLLLWDNDITEAINAGKISVASARPIAGLDDPSMRTSLLLEAIRYGATARTTSAWVQSARASNPVDPSAMQTNAAGTVLPAPSIPHSECWACKQSGPVSTMSYLPTCPQCLETLPQALAAICPSTPIAPVHQ